MNGIIAASLTRLINLFAALMGHTAVGQFVCGQIAGIAMRQTQEVGHHGSRLVFSVPNALNRFRVKTFSTKEPETLEWIDNIPSDAVVWDVGANVGLYTCYAAKARGCRVFAFEPSVFNLELLARNIFLNEVTDLATIVPLALSDALAFSKLNMTTTEWGGALSTFGNSFGFDGRLLAKTFELPTIGLSMDDATALLGIPKPDYIKIDVDGIEHLILRGGGAVLENAKGILIEINDAFEQQAEETARHLTAAGLKLKERRRWEGTDNTPFATTFNEIWFRQR